jgi:peroxiredoxin
MKLFVASAMAALALLIATPTLRADAAVDRPAPDFTLMGSDGKTHHLSDYKGQFVVLEWTNKDCPFVKKHYGSGNMQKLQKEYTARKVAWLTIISSAPGKQGFVTAAEANETMLQQAAAPTAILLDSDGKVGRLYGAKTTPDIVVVNPSGILIYSGAIDDKPSTNPEDIATAKNYLSSALDAAMAGKAVTTPWTKSYGCSVKY